MTTTDLLTHTARGAQPVPAGRRASDVMTSDVATVLTTTTVGEALLLMRTLRIRHLPVLGLGRFVGLVDDRLVTQALLAASARDAVLEQPVSTAMTHDVPQVAPNVSLQRVATLLRTSRCDAIVVVDAQEHLLGVITMVDVVTAVALGDVQPPREPNDVDRPAAVTSADTLTLNGARS